MIRRLLGVKSEDFDEICTSSSIDRLVAANNSVVPPVKRSGSSSIKILNDADEVTGIARTL